MLTIREVKGLDELIAVGKLIHDKYKEVGYFSGNQYNCLLYSQHFHPGTTTFIAYVTEGNPLATMAVVEREKAGFLPFELWCRDFRPEEKASCEVIGLASIGVLKVTMALLEYVICDWGTKRGLEHVYIGVNPRHEKFYRRRLGFEKVAEYPHRLLGLDAVILYAKVKDLASTFERN